MYDIPLYLGYKLSADNTQIIGKKGQVMTLRSSKSRPGGEYLHCLGYINNKITAIYLHRAIASVHCEGYFEGAWVDHVDGNPANNHPSNLQWVKPIMNVPHYKRKGPYNSKKYLREMIDYHAKKLEKYKRLLSEI